MARLAEYMQHLASMLGEVEGVHFRRLEEGSTRLVAALQGGTASQRVQNRVLAVRDRRAPAEAQRAYDHINDMVGADGTSARVIFGASVILRFPGRDSRRQQPVSIIDSGTVTGRLYALIEDGSGLLNARIRPRDGSNYVNCTAANRSVEKDLKEYFQDAVRVHGRGTWTRSEFGVWSCASLRISEVEPVENVSLREAINALRAIEVEWPDDPLAGMDAIEERDGAA